MALNGIPISEDDCIGDSLYTINAAFTALDDKLLSIQSDVFDTESKILNVIRTGEFVGSWITQPVNLTSQKTNYFLKYNHAGETPGDKWVVDTNLYASSNAIGIGNANPLAKLHISTASNQIGLRVDSTESYAGTEVVGLSGGYTRLTRKGTGKPYMVELTSVLSGTNLADGVGVGGAINVLGDYFTIQTGSSVNTLSSLLFVSPNNGGRIGFGGITNPLARLDIGALGDGGDIRFRGGTSTLFDFILDAKDNNFRIKRFNKGATTGETTLFTVTSSGNVSITNSQLNVAPTSTSVTKPTTWTGGITTYDLFSDGGTIGAGEGSTNTVKASLNSAGTIQGIVLNLQPETAGGEGNIKIGGQLGGYIDFKVAEPGSVSNTSSQLRIGKSNIKGNYIQSIGDFRIHHSNTISDSFSNTTTFTSGGRIGLNYDNPVTKLHVNGAITVEGETIADATIDSDNESNVYFLLGAAGSTDDRALIRQVGGNNNYHLAIDLHDTILAAGVNQIGQTFSVRNIGSSADPDEVTSMLHVTTNAEPGSTTPKVRVGINTATPTTTLDINGDTIIRNNLTVQGTLQAAVALSVDAVNTPYVLSDHVRTQLLYLSGGSVDSALLGTNYLKYNGTNSINNNNTNAYIAFGPAGKTLSDMAVLRQIGVNNEFHLALDLHDDTDGDPDGQSFSIRNINIYGATTNFKVAGSGNVGINQENPTGVLHIKSQGSIPTVKITSDNNTNQNALTIENQSSTQLVVNSAGYMGIATSNPQYPLDVVGATRTTNLTADITTITTNLYVTGTTSINNTKISSDGVLSLGRRNNLDYGGLLTFARAFDNNTAFSIGVTGTNTGETISNPTLRILNQYGKNLMVATGAGEFGFNSLPVTSKIIAVSGDVQVLGNSSSRSFTVDRISNTQAGNISFINPVNNNKKFQVEVNPNGNSLRFITFGTTASAENITIYNPSNNDVYVGINQPIPTQPLDVNGAIIGNQIISRGALRTNNITLLENQINSGYELDESYSELSINKTTLYNRFRNFAVYSGKSGTNNLRFIIGGDLAVDSGVVLNGNCPHGIVGSLALSGNLIIDGEIQVKKISYTGTQPTANILMANVTGLDKELADKVSINNLVGIPFMSNTIGNWPIATPSGTIATAQSYQNFLQYGKIMLPKAPGQTKGVMIQWGVIMTQNISDYLEVKVTFPESFAPNTVPVVFLQCQKPLTPLDKNGYPAQNKTAEDPRFNVAPVLNSGSRPITHTQFWFNMRNIPNGNVVYASNYSWIAYGSYQ